MTTDYPEYLKLHESIETRLALLEQAIEFLRQDLKKFLFSSDDRLATQKDLKILSLELKLK